MGPIKPVDDEATRVVDGRAQIIVAHTLPCSMSDHGQLVPLIDGIVGRVLGASRRDVGLDGARLKAREVLIHILCGNDRRFVEALCTIAPNLAADTAHVRAFREILQDGVRRFETVS